MIVMLGSTVCALRNLVLGGPLSTRYSFFQEGLCKATNLQGMVLSDQPACIVHSFNLRLKIKLEQTVHLIDPVYAFLNGTRFESEDGDDSLEGFSDNTWLYLCTQCQICASAANKLCWWLKYSFSIVTPVDLWKYHPMALWRKVCPQSQRSPISPPGNQ